MGVSEEKLPSFQTDLDSQIRTRLVPAMAEKENRPILGGPRDR
jgi:hypothetical protein